LSQDGSIGKELKAKMLASFDKSQEPNAPKMKKPLPAPDDRPKKRRGGKRYRKMKEKFGLTDLRKMQNRLKFGEDVTTCDFHNS
jgi:U4/U6 small nuclear ribonucleoprotein PRP31